MKTSSKIYTIAGIIIFIAFLVMLNQWVWWPGHWWDLDQTLHHEDYTLILIAAAIGMLVAAALLKSRKK